MTHTDALALLNELRKLDRYWLPDPETRRFLESVDFDARMGKKGPKGADSTRLQKIYREVMEIYGTRG